MSYSQDVPLVTVTVSPDFNFFGDDSRVVTTVTPVLNGTRSIRRGSWWGDTINGRRPIVSQHQRAFTLPVVEYSGWSAADGTAHGAWSYDVDVFVSAPDRSSVLWSGNILPTSTAPVTLTPADGTVVSEVAVGTAGRVNPARGGLTLGGGEGGSVSITPDPAVPGSYLIGE